MVKNFNAIQDEICRFSPIDGILEKLLNVKEGKKDFQFKFNYISCT